MKLTMHRYQDEDDYWRIREFLRKVLLLNDRRQLSWHIARLDYWRWHAIENCQACDPVEAVTFIWETSDGQIAAVLNPEDIGQVFLQVHPNLRTLELEDELVAIAEKHLTRPGSDGKQKLWVWADAHDDLRHDVLTRRGYTCVKSPGEQEYQRRRPMSMPIPNAPVAEGYSAHTLQRRTHCMPRSGSPNTIHASRGQRDFDVRSVLPRRCIGLRILRAARLNR